MGDGVDWLDGVVVVTGGDSGSGDETNEGTGVFVGLTDACTGGGGILSVAVTEFLVLRVGFSDDKIANVEA